MKTPFDHFRGLPCMCYGNIDECVCPDGEMALRHYAKCHIMPVHPMPPMTVEQRDWCLREIDRVEGFESVDYERSTDSDLACTVLQAWIEYCRDKGLCP